MIIAIDGPAGAGKSTLAKHIAETFGFFNLNSGNFYRAVTYAVLQSGNGPEKEENVLETARNSTVELRDGRIFLNGLDIEDRLHTDAVDEYVAQHSAIIEVRKIVNDIIRKVTSNMDVVAEGRDMTTVVFPHADIKVYLDADLDIRTERRLHQGTSALNSVQIRNNLKNRDNIDKNKPFGKLTVAAGALYLDSTLLTIEEVCEKVQNKIAEQMKKR